MVGGHSLGFVCSTLKKNGRQAEVCVCVQSVFLFVRVSGLRCVLSFGFVCAESVAGTALRAPTFDKTTARRKVCVVAFFL